ncbi:MAG: hypothetical protein HKN84_08345, partial [Gammaproteobacteria bacterium]|nr:hypothetical protein [Gammaproteobacteria bacterium]
MREAVRRNQRRFLLGVVPTGWRKLILCVLPLSLVAVSASAQLSYEAQRNALANEIAREVRETRSYTGKARLDPAVMDAVRTVPRHEFIPAQLRASAYANRPLPIGDGQTISQPYIVALMTD